jgi:uncharacterized membrane protein YhaH (DUF805 family)
MPRIALYIPLVIIYLSGIVVLLDVFTDGLLDNAAAFLGLWVSIILAFALLLGLGNILLVHLRRLRKGGVNALYSAALLLSTVGVVGVGIFGQVSGQRDAYTNWIYQYLYQPLVTTLFSLLAFLSLLAAVKSLRIGTIESFLLLVGAIIVLLGQVALAPFANINQISRWFQDYPVQGILRGVIIGAALGALAASLRYLLGVDNKYLR